MKNPTAEVKGVVQETGCNVQVIANDYTYSGYLACALRKRKGAIRFVIEDSEGRLFIHNALQCGFDEPDPIPLDEYIVSITG